MSRTRPDTIAIASGPLLRRNAPMPVAPPHHRSPCPKDQHIRLILLTFLLITLLLAGCAVDRMTEAGNTDTGLTPSDSGPDASGDDATVHGPQDVAHDDPTTDEVPPDAAPIDDVRPDDSGDASDISDAAEVSDTADDADAPPDTPPDVTEDASTDAIVADPQTDAQPLAAPFPYVRPAILDIADRSIESVCAAYCAYVQDCFAPICPPADYPEDYVTRCTPGCVGLGQTPDFLIQTMADYTCPAFTHNICDNDPATQARCSCPVVAPIEESTVGAACASDGDCSTGTLAPRCFTGAGLDSVWPGGYCTANACHSDGACGPDAVCVVGADANACSASCDPAHGRADCRDGYTCWPRGDAGVCAPDCEHLPCPADGRCHAATGLCFPM